MSEALPDHRQAPLPTRYLYFRDADHHPRITIALMQHPDKSLSYGWSICGRHDQPRYGSVAAWYAEPWIARWQNEGRPIAYRRALGARYRGKQIADNVWRYARDIRRDEALAVIDACGANALLMLVWHDTYAALPLAMQPPWTKEMPANAAS